eukprot:CAMPEP_0197554822 /NCGR_PEP_ID=MMETSP1320-20131121/12103_1 /TAXON_ID=91990 /ORGANISM="Bolidomonas sp., Strain RCC2347" /LENGTH=55 /DNA_ID=CAMNT_0043115753 /DNA_START=145 /DNA_END=312 /DNA_ORIENTATION=-
MPPRPSPLVTQRTKAVMELRGPSTRILAVLPSSSCSKFPLSPLKVLASVLHLALK